MRRHAAAILGAAFLLAISCLLPSCTPAAVPGAGMQTLDKNDPAFFKKMYTDAKGYKMPYRVYVPANYDADKKYPLIFFFHSGSGRGFNNEQQIMHENAAGTHVWTLPANQAQFPAFVLAPQCSIGDNWGDPDLNEINPRMQMALDILAAVQKDYSIDADRIVLVGESMGGLGVWALLQTFPEKWAAAMVLGSYDNFTNEKAIAQVPLWLFQGGMDLTVPTELVRTDGEAAAGKAGRASVRYTEYPKNESPKSGMEGDFAEPELVPWAAARATWTDGSRASLGRLTRPRNSRDCFAGCDLLLSESLAGLTDRLPRRFSCTRFFLRCRFFLLFILGFCGAFEHALDH